MTTKFTAEDKQERSQGAPGFYQEGVYPVQIVNVTAGTNAKGNDFLEFEIVSEEGDEGKVSLYFTEASKGYSFKTVRSIFVHNTKEENKESMKDKVNEAETLEDLLKLCEALRGKEAWLLVKKSGTTYTNPTSGKTYENLNRNLYGYEPKFVPTPPSAAQKVKDVTGGEEITKDNVSEFPF